MNIRVRILLWFLIPSVLIATIVGVFYYVYTRKTLEQNVFNQLETAAGSLHENVQIFLESKRGRTIDFSADGFVRVITEKITMRERTIEHYTSALSHHLITNKKSLDPNIDEILVIDFKDRVIASTDESRIGEVVPIEKYFSEGIFADVSVGEPYYDARLQETIIDFSTVLLTRIGKEPIGVIVNRIKIEQGADRIRDGESALPARIGPGGQDTDNDYPKLIAVNKSRIIDFSSDGFIRDFTEEIVRIDEKAFYHADLLNTHLLANLQPLDTDVLSMFVVDLDGRVISSTEISQIGRDVSDETFFTKTIKRGSCISDLYHLPDSGQKTFFNVARLLKNKTNDITIGIIVIRYSGDYFGMAAQSNISELQETGDVYIVNGNKLMITGSRFIKDAVFKQVVDTEGVMAAFENDSGMTGIYPDYRGVSVLGASRYLEELDWVILAEKDVSEAFAPLVYLRNSTFIMGIVGILVLAAAAIFISKGITNPIRRLAAHAHNIAKGNLHEEIRVKSRDEIGSLASSFDTMRIELGKSFKNIEMRERQQAAISELGMHALEDPDINTLLNEAVSITAVALGVEYCKILELLPDGKALLLKAGVGWKTGSVGYVTVGAGNDSQAGYTLHSDKPVVVGDIRTETRFSAPSLLLEHRVVSGMSIIIKGKDRPFGVMGVHTTRPRVFTSDDANFLLSVSNVVANAIERKRLSAHIDHVARYDTLTDLPNRILFIDRVTRAVSHAKREKEQIAVLYLNLDRFKVINDSMGNETGDGLLKSVAERMVKCVREGDTVSRMGGDEFAIMLVGITSASDVTKVSQKIIEAVSEPYVLDDREMHITASIGISMYPYDDEKMEGLINKARAAMLQAKEHGRNNDRFYNMEMETSSYEMMMLENDLRKALDRRELLLYYQPQVDINTGRIIGVEALVRWRHPDRGIVSPAEFIPLAEETGLIMPIGKWVLHTALAQNKAWQEDGLAPIKMSVNFSSVQFRQKDPVEIVANALRETGLKPGYMELEITESVIMKGADAVIKKFHELKEIGIHICMDDFGTGYSSLSYLKRFPIDILKIDQSFARNVTTDTNDASIVMATIAMAHGLGMTTVAEGVETKEQLEFFRSQKCEVVQGYLFSKPLPAEEITKLLREGGRFEI